MQKHFNKNRTPNPAFDPTNEFKKLRTPFRKDLEMYGKITNLMGTNQVKVACEDATERICRIPGKMFRHIWIKTNDIVIIKLWDFQPSKADVVWRYQGFQKNALERRGELTKLYAFTHDEVSNNPRYLPQNNTPQKEESSSDIKELPDSDNKE
jgi:translation initiation factor 1A